MTICYPSLEGGRIARAFAGIIHNLFQMLDVKADPTIDASREQLLPVLPYCVLHGIVRRMVETSAPFSKLELELRRGAIVLAALSQLKTAQYGYSLRQALAARGMEIEEGTLYPLLRRLEGQGLLTSEWQIRDGPPRRYYVLSADGEQLYARLSTSWRALSVVMDDLIDDGAGQ